MTEQWTIQQCTVLCCVLCCVALCCAAMIKNDIYVFFTLFGYWARAGGVSQGIGTQLAHAVFHPGQLKNASFRNFFFDTVIT